MNANVSAICPDRKCWKCRVPKPLDAVHFSRDRKSPGGFSKSCLECLEVLRNEREHRAPKPRAAAASIGPLLIPAATGWSCYRHGDHCRIEQLNEILPGRPNLLAELQIPEETMDQIARWWLAQRGSR